MTRQINIKECYITIAIWIVISAVPVVGIISVQGIYDSYDESGCRSHMTSDRIICHRDQDVESEKGYWQDSGENINGLVSSKSSVMYHMIPWAVVFIMIQIVALVCWNEHYKWFSVNIKSCWSDKE